jgi:hypothetical protein
MVLDRIIRTTLVGGLLALYAAGALAQSAPPVERLSDRASDEQRVDNCKVPLDRRGPKIRPDACTHGGASAALTRRAKVKAPSRSQDSLATARLRC